MKKFLTVIVSVFVAVSLVACGLSTNTNQTPTTKEACGKDYETQVFNAFWEGACGSFGVNYSDYKMLHTATSYICDSTTSDGYTAHYYLIKTAFDTKNVFGQKINHEVTARCYYVPDYSNVVYTTYITLDGEKILFDEETEEWLLGIGGNSANVNDMNITTPQNEQQPTSTPETAATNQGNTNKTEQYSGTTNDGGNSNSSTGNNKMETTAHTHTYGGWTNSNSEQHKRVCLICNNTDYANHSWNDGQVTQAATCATNGITTYNCEVCGGSKTETIAKSIEHLWDGGKVTRVATCTAEGITTYTCNVCKNQKTEPLAKAAHDFSQKVESSKYLKCNASFYSGTTYYYSCACGEKGSKNFCLNDRKEWISEDQLYQSHRYGCAWMGEYIWIGKTDFSTNTVYNYKIYGSPASRLETGVVYSGNCNGKIIRFKYESSNIYFNFNDLAAAGII